MSHLNYVIVLCCTLATLPSEISTYPGIIWNWPPSRTWVKYELKGSSKRQRSGVMRVATLGKEVVEDKECEWLECRVIWRPNDELAAKHVVVLDSISKMLVQPHERKSRVPVLTNISVIENYHWNNYVGKITSMSIRSGLLELRSAHLNVVPLKVKLRMKGKERVKTKLGEIDCKRWSGSSRRRLRDNKIYVLKYDVWVSKKAYTGVVKATWKGSTLPTSDEQGTTLGVTLLLTEQGKNPAAELGVPIKLRQKGKDR